MESEDKFSAVIIKDGKPTVQEVDGRPLKEGEVKIRVEASPINPSDRGFLSGSYGIKELLPTGELGAGFEGAGVVVEAHESVGTDLVGKTVAFSDNCHSPTFQGVWRKYIYLPAAILIPFPEGTEPSKVFAVFVNPLTVLLMINQAKKFGHKALVHGAACSTLGKMLAKYAKKVDFPVIHLVRRQEQVDILKELGAEHILDSSTETFDSDLQNLSKEIGATAYFDPIAGDFCTQVLTKLPAGSTAYVYGGLSGKPVTLSPIDIIFYQKSISFLYLSVWYKQSTKEEQKEAIGEVVGDLIGGGEIFGSQLYKTYSLSDLETALSDSVEHATKGKVCLNPQL
ncbi:unnamed protein product [Moneuplotes crassus]|uniref:Enoyl reductase (ER) domain-containing protein n=1 Tax=Euplotes crassus TaxID=5936 RepID=A0AAD2CZ87_EUPCR|nr:unnamed protein product [Moneuplotes crassus]